MATSYGTNARGGIAKSASSATKGTAAGYNKSSSPAPKAGTTATGSTVGLSASQISGLQGLKGVDQNLVANYKPNAVDTSGRVITANNLRPNAPVAVPTPVQTLAPDVNAGNAGVSGTGTGITATPAGLTVDPIVENSLATSRQNFNDMLASLNSAEAKRTTGADVQNKVIKDSHQKEYQKSVNDYTSQINNIVATRDAATLAVTGQGRGIPEVIIGGQQAEINKEAAIKALPIQALLATAQGNLDTANQYINTWGKILMDDANNKYNHKVATIEAVYNFADKQEQTKLASLQTQAKEKKDKELALATAKTQAIQLALGQNAPASIINAITNATDLMGVATGAGIYNGDVLAQQIKRKQLQALNAPVGGYSSQLSGGDTKPVPSFEEFINAKQNEQGMSFTPATKESYRAEYNKLASQGTNYSNVVNTILGSGKFTKDQSAAIANAINNGEDPLTVIKNNAKNLLGQTESSKITNFEIAKSSLLDIQSALIQFYANGGDTGLLSGNYEKVINKLGNVNDPKLVDLATQIQSGLQIYRNAVSGTAYSTQEGADIASIFPGINKSQGLNTAIMNGRIKAFDYTIDGAYRSVLGKQYDSLKTSGDTTQTTNTPDTIFNSVVQPQTQTTQPQSSPNVFGRVWSWLTS